MRDVHELKSYSTSPPPKRKKSPTEEVSETEIMETESDSLDDLSFKLEDMEIDPFEDVDLLIERSIQKDEKIMENNSKNEEKERLQLKERNDSEKKKKKTVELKTEKVKLVMKKQKQQKKDEKKKEKKKRNSKIISSSDGQKFRIPNIRKIPENCKHLSKENEVVYNLNHI